ncbi:uncharacterized protein LOC143539815 [Bidens hawaiensis]|uniref:uncharacterized protein LOC143539815 n=1 Tax=Bidens hawaiensis TaxID=980011 RepID=UPI004049E073
MSLVDRICKTVIGKASHNEAWTILGSAIPVAVRYGIHELIEECILAYPGVIWYNASGFSLLLAAILQRQERVYNLVYQMSRHKIHMAVAHRNQENVLHIAGKLAPPHRLNVVTGAALQVQRELQWFQEVQKFVHPSYEEALNKEKQTPRMVFTDAHKGLLKDEREWMKDTSSSCTVVAALIVTMAFAAAFTLPGGNEDNGSPLFLNHNSFMLFIVADAVALFSSSTSVLMFLGILTSRYAEDDFLYSLPKRLTIGLLSLFMSIAATMIAFSSALVLVLKDKVTWVAAPLIIVTSIPVCLFALLQIPLLVELVNSTYGRTIYKAALLDDWDSVSELFEREPELMTKQITYWWETPLIIAVGTNRSHRFVKKLIERIVAVGAQDRIFVTSYGGNNPLHYAAKVGNTAAARLLVEQNSDMTRVPNPYHNTPLKLAAWHGHKETLKYLLEVTRDLLPGEEGVSPYTGVAGGDLITLTIMAGFYDVALEIIDLHPNILLESDRNGKTALQILAQKPEIFPSGSRLGFWGRMIYSLIPVKKIQATTHSCNSFISNHGILCVIVAPTIKNIHDIKVNNKLSSSLVERICKIVIEKVDHDITWNILRSAITTAVKYGTHELIEECILTYPGIIWYDVGGFCLFLAAIKQRQERVYNLVHQMSGHKVFAATQLDGEENENALHIAAKLAPPHRLNVVTGAALQMQRELQWFQEVEKFIEPSYKEDLNKKGQTPRMVFTEAHKDLLAEGQQWMKDTASSCTVVAALLVTMAFAAAFTLPGGNQDNGNPMFLTYNTFMLFIVSDAVALFSSSTSVLMFLGILTSRYAEDDFLYALPKRLTIGLLSLFMSIAATMIAFSSALALVLKDKVTWIAAPLIIATSIPVCLFALLQFPLLVELVNSTYGRSVFRQQNARRIH